MKRISKQAKAIADAHIAARLTGNFNPCAFRSTDELKSALRNGYTFSAVMDEIEIRFCSITGAILARTFQYRSAAYKASVYKAFKQILD